MRLHLDEPLIRKTRERLAERHEREPEPLGQAEDGKLRARRKLAAEDRAADHVRRDLGLRAVGLHGGWRRQDATSGVPQRSGEHACFRHIFHVI